MKFFLFKHDDYNSRGAELDFSGNFESLQAAKSAFASVPAERGSIGTIDEEGNLIFLVSWYEDLRTWQ